MLFDLQTMSRSGPLIALILQEFQQGLTQKNFYYSARTISRSCDCQAGVSGTRASGVSKVQLQVRRPEEPVLLRARKRLSSSQQGESPIKILMRDKVESFATCSH